MTWDALRNCMDQPDAGRADFYCILPTPPREQSGNVESRSGSVPHEPPPSGATHANAVKHSDSSSGAHLDGDAQAKRHRNMEAARRYRQRKADRIAELEQALLQANKELEATKLRLAESEAEVRVLRKVVGRLSSDQAA